VTVNLGLEADVVTFVTLLGGGVWLRTHAVLRSYMLARLAGVIRGQ
jgi:hypothetical protein